jgi:hypothetical protein
MTAENLILEPGSQDQRDYVLGSLAPDNVSAPFVWDVSRLPLDFDLKPYDEFTRDQLYQDCTGNALVNALELMVRLRGASRRYSPLFPYYNGRNVLASILGKPIEDVGVSLHTVMGTATREGVCLEATWPAYMPPNDRPSDAAYAEGLLHRVGRYERCGRDSYHIVTGEAIRRDKVADVKMAVYHGMPVVFGIALSAEFYNITGPLETHTYSPPTMYGPGYIGGHAMVIIGWRTLPDGSTRWIVENSWGPQWGDGGFWGMTDAALSATFDLFAVRSFDDVYAPIPFKFYRWTADCDLRDGTSVSIQPHAAQVYRLYRAAFSREPDLPGIGWHMATIEGGAQLVDVAGGFIAAPEFTATYGALDDAQFVTQLYRNVLGREPEPEGLAYHVARLQSGASRAQVLLGFSESPENIAATPTANGVRYIRRTQ